MIAEVADTNFMGRIKAKVSAYIAFTKLRLTLLVVISSAIGYAIGVESFLWIDVAWLSLAGYFTTGASNGFNQIIERDIDKLMKRTMSRPIPTGKMSIGEGIVLSSVLGIVGLAILYYHFNLLAATLGFLALFSYVALYTPMKKHSSWAVFVGAFPGAIPPMLGYVAATNDFDLYAGLLFAVQFVWQFPHFWAIAWVADEDYKKAGYHLLPSKGGKDDRSAFLILIYTLFLIPAGILPWVFDLIGLVPAILAAVAGALFSIPAWKFYMSKSDKGAKSVMFASFFYLPVILLIYLFSAV